MSYNSDHKPDWWMGGEKTTKLGNASKNFWAWIKATSESAREQQNALTCASQFLPLLAWQRDIRYLNNEPEQQFRKRIHYAYENALDSGTAAGFKRIFQRLDLGPISVEERVPGLDWDVVVLTVTSSILKNNPKYLDWIIEKYGRTCRRYEWHFTVTTMFNMYLGEVGSDSLTVEATL